MFKPKKQVVELIVAKYGMKQEFSIEHAERLLAMGEFLNGGWSLPSDSKYVFDEENGLRVKSDKGNTDKAS